MTETNWEDNVETAMQREKEQKHGEDARIAVFLHRFSDTMRQTCLLLGEWSAEEWVWGWGEEGEGGRRYGSGVTQTGIKGGGGGGCSYI